MMCSHDRVRRMTRILGMSSVLWVMWVCGPEVLTASDAHAAHGSMTAWNSTPRLLISLALTIGVYLVGLIRLWRQAGIGKGVARMQAASYIGGWLVLVIALVSPLDAVSSELFAVHMIQHLLLILVAAPLIVLGAPLFVALWALPDGVRRAVGARLGRDSLWRASWDVVSQPLLVWSAFFATLWLWHIPGLYEAALRSQLVHDIQHLGFMTAACMTWWILLNPMGRLKLSRGSGILYLFTTSLHAAALGVLLTFSPVAWYEYYSTTTAGWGLTWLEDQQLAGIIMWMPACFVYIVIAGAIFTLWLRESEKADRRLERFARVHLYGDAAERRREFLRTPDRHG